MRNQNTLGLTVFQTDSGGQVEDTKALGIMYVEGTLAKLPGNFGRWELQFSI